MAAAAYTLVIEPEATYKLTLTLHDGPTTASPPMNLTGWEPRMQIRPSAESIDVLLDCRPSNGRLVVLDEALGKVQLVIPRGDTARMDFAQAVYDLVIRGATETRRVIAGPVLISPAVTR